jgi:hypothetical protein
MPGLKRKEIVSIIVIRYIAKATFDGDTHNLNRFQDYLQPIVQFKLLFCRNNFAYLMTKPWDRAQILTRVKVVTDVLVRWDWTIRLWTMRLQENCTGILIPKLTGFVR